MRVMMECYAKSVEVEEQGSLVGLLGCFRPGLIQRWPTNRTCRPQMEKLGKIKSEGGKGGKEWLLFS